jgi:microcystin-dependent protein
MTVGAGTLTVANPPALGITLISVLSTGITTQGDGPHRGYFTEGDLAPIRNNTATYHTQSTNIGASTDYTFTLADMSAGSVGTVRDGLIAIQATNSGINTYLGARVYVGGETATPDVITVNLNATTDVTTFGIVYGNAGSDNIYGSTGNDYLFGGDDNDTIFGGAGSDTIDGGNGTDTLLYSTGLDGKDTIINFRSGVDKLNTDFLSTAPNFNFEALAMTGTVTDGTITNNTVNGVLTATIANSGLTATSTTQQVMVALENSVINGGNGTTANGSFFVTNMGAGSYNFLLAVYNGTNTYLLEVAERPGDGNGLIDLGDVSLVGVFAGITLAQGDII